MHFYDSDGGGGAPDQAAERQLQEKRAEVEAQAQRSASTAPPATEVEDLSGSWHVADDSADCALAQVGDEALLTEIQAGVLTAICSGTMAGVRRLPVENSDDWKQLCEQLPCFDALKRVETEIRGEPVVVQLWKGWCQKSADVELPGRHRGRGGRLPPRPGPQAARFATVSAATQPGLDPGADALGRQRRPLVARA